MVLIRSTQKLFTLEEVARLTGICADTIIELARSRHLGLLTRAAEAAGKQAEEWLFSPSDLMILNVLHSNSRAQT